MTMFGLKCAELYERWKIWKIVDYNSTVGTKICTIIRAQKNLEKVSLHREGFTDNFEAAKDDEVTKLEDASKDNEAS